MNMQINQPWNFLLTIIILLTIACQIKYLFF